MEVTVKSNVVLLAPIVALSLVGGLAACSALPRSSSVDAPIVASTQPAPQPETEPVAEVPVAEVPTSTLSVSQQAAVRSAESYLRFMGFSRQGLIDQLSSEFGDQFPVEDATVAVDSLNVDWNAQAARSAQSYLDMMGFSCDGLIDQLSSEYGDKYTVEQATYGAQQVGLC